MEPLSPEGEGGVKVLSATPRSQWAAPLRLGRAMEVQRRRDKRAFLHLNVGPVEAEEMANCLDAMRRGQYRLPESPGIRTN